MARSIRSASDDAPLSEPAGEPMAAARLTSGAPASRAAGPRPPAAAPPPSMLPAAETEAVAVSESVSGSVAVGAASWASAAPGAEHRAERPGSADTTSRRHPALPEHAVSVLRHQLFGCRWTVEHDEWYRRCAGAHGFPHLSLPALGLGGLTPR